ncbi:hypothetical protein DENSPDRAFT_880449 [Dentipellis sp. KUC8613]|nr:hypothetical protein DENSPDRAFT_880449 [Dentipellis sp. KUC8613]
MSFKALVYAYVLGGLTFIPLVVLGLIAFTVYTSVPVGDPDAAKQTRGDLEKKSAEEQKDKDKEKEAPASPDPAALDLNDIPKARRGWLTMRRTFEEHSFDTSYVTLVKSFLDARSKDPKRSRPRDMWYVVLKGKVLYLYEDESMTECEAAIELSSHEIVIYPEGLLDGELFAKRNAICLKPRLDVPPQGRGMFSVTREMRLWREDVDEKVEKSGKKKKKDKEREREKIEEQERRREIARVEAMDASTPWFIFVRSNYEMEDWYISLIHASDNPPNTPFLSPLLPVFSPADMFNLVATLDEQPDVIPMRWMNALLGRVFFSYYRTDALESYVIGRLMKKLSKVKRPHFLSDVVVTEVFPGNKSPTFSKPMLKELTKEGDAALEVRLQYKGEFRITLQASATINLGSAFKPYTVKLVLAVILRELEGNMVIKVKRPPSSRIWYAFTQMPKMVLDVEPVVSDRQITWSMILNTIESKLKEIILESVVLPNMDDISYFDSRQCQHRGGIWPDAARHERPAGGRKHKRRKGSRVPPAPEEGSSSASTPIGEGSSASSEGDLAAAPRSRSETELNHELNPTPNSSEPNLIPPSRSASVFVENHHHHHGHPSHHITAPIPVRRKTWFSNHLGNHKSHSQQSLVEEPEPLEGTDELEDSPTYDNGRQHSMDSYSSDTHHKRARFLPVRKMSRSPSPIRSRPTSPLPSPTTERAHNRSPEPSIHSLSSSHKSAKSTKSKESGFLSTLKSRAGDRQALKNAANETMKKWGWARKDTHHEGDKDEEGHEEGESRSSGESMSTTSRKIGSSWAELRAHVDERRERERSEKTPTPPLPSPRIDHHHPSSPISVPRRTSMSSQHSLNAPSFVSGSNRSSSPLSFHAPVVSAEPSQSSASSATEGRASPHPIVVTDVPVSESPDSSPPSPIHTQPLQGKTMMIPGIHAKHRGEVMSMGYAPPSPPQPSIVEGKGKAPGIQSVYSRLWRGGQAEADMTLQVTHSEPPEQTFDSPLSPSAHEATRRARTPPPLPLRGAPGSSSASLSPSWPYVSDASPASAALKSIANRDGQQRGQQIDGSEVGGGPPPPDISITAPSPVSPLVSSRPPLPPRRPPPAPPTAA